MTHSSCILQLAINFCWASPSFLIICGRKKKPRDLRRLLKKQKLLSHLIQNALSTYSRYIHGLHSSPYQENWRRKCGPGTSAGQPMNIQELCDRQGPTCRDTRQQWVQPFGVCGPRWKKKSCLEPLIKYTNTKKN